MLGSKSYRRKIPWKVQKKDLGIVVAFLKKGKLGKTNYFWNTKGNKVERDLVEKIHYRNGTTQIITLMSHQTWPRWVYQSSGFSLLKRITIFVTEAYHRKFITGMYHRNHYWNVSPKSLPKRLTKPQLGYRWAHWITYRLTVPRRRH